MDSASNFRLAVVDSVRGILETRLPDVDKGRANGSATVAVGGDVWLMICYVSRMLAVCGLHCM